VFSDIRDNDIGARTGEFAHACGTQARAAAGNEHRLSSNVQSDSISSSFGRVRCSALRTSELRVQTTIPWLIHR
jgi:hypothetical protein